MLGTANTLMGPAISNSALLATGTRCAFNLLETNISLPTFPHIESVGDVVLILTLFLREPVSPGKD